jgi:hypothetical protein
MNGEMDRLWRPNSCFLDVAWTGGGMPWRERHVEDERLRFVARMMEGRF